MEPTQKANPTNHDLQDMIVQLHGCVEQHRKDDRLDHKEVSGRLSSQDAKIDDMRGTQLVMMRAIGIDPATAPDESYPPPYKRRSVALMGQREVLWKNAISVGGIVFLVFSILRIAEGTWPYLVALGPHIVEFLLGINRVLVR